MPRSKSKRNQKPGQSGEGQLKRAQQYLGLRALGQSNAALLSRSLVSTTVLYQADTYTSRRNTLHFINTTNQLHFSTVNTKQQNRRQFTGAVRAPPIGLVRGRGRGGV